MDEKTKKFDEALAMETQDHLKKIGEELNKKKRGRYRETKNRSSGRIRRIRKVI